jgi:hypothetical protein
MSDQIDQDINKYAVKKYADSIILWGGFFRATMTVFAWIYLIGGPVSGLVFVALGAEMTYFLMGILAGAVGALTLLGYRLIFDYMLMKAHQTKG